jgi:hypothetical protein
MVCPERPFVHQLAGQLKCDLTPSCATVNIQSRGYSYSRIYEPTIKIPFLVTIRVNEDLVLKETLIGRTPLPLLSTFEPAMEVDGSITV